MFLSVKDLTDVYLGPLTSRQDVADISRKAWFPVQRCGDENPPRWMQPQSRRSVSNRGAPSGARVPGGEDEVPDRGIRSPLVVARIHLNGDTPFLSQSGDRRQEVVLGKLLFHSRGEDRLPRRCKKSLAVSSSVFLFK